MLQEENNKLQLLLQQHAADAFVSSIGLKEHKITASQDTSTSLVRNEITEATKHALEKRLRIMSDELDVTSSKLAVAESRAREHAAQSEALHIDLLTARTIAKTVHTNALEGLPAQERMQYEIQKVALRQEYSAQKTDFESQEADALLRHQARMRARAERTLDEALEAVRFFCILFFYIFKTFFFIVAKQA